MKPKLSAGNSDASKFPLASDTYNDNNNIITINTIMGDDDRTVPEAEVYNCPYQDVKDETKPCPYKSKSDIMIGAHKRAIRLKKNVTKVKIKDEVAKEDTKKSKGII